MPQRKVYHVSPDKEGWTVKEERGKRAVGRFENKEEAVTRGRELASRQPLGQVIIKKNDGTIEEERTYGRDPYPPEG